jgi:hypothetical protein
MECFRYHYEDLFYEFGVDIILNGHVHAVSEGVQQGSTTPQCSLQPCCSRSMCTELLKG